MHATFQLHTSPCAGTDGNWLDCSEEEAAQAYDIAAIQHRGSKVSVPDLCVLPSINACWLLLQWCSYVSNDGDAFLSQAVTNFSAALYEDASLPSNVGNAHLEDVDRAEDNKARCASAGSMSGNA